MPIDSRFCARAHNIYSLEPLGDGDYSPSGLISRKASVQPAWVQGVTGALTKGTEFEASLNDVLDWVEAQTGAKVHRGTHFQMTFGNSQVQGKPDWVIETRDGRVMVIDAKRGTEHSDTAYLFQPGMYAQAIEQNALRAGGADPRKADSVVFQGKKVSKIGTAIFDDRAEQAVFDVFRRALGGQIDARQAAGQILDAITGGSYSGNQPAGELSSVKAIVSDPLPKQQLQQGARALEQYNIKVAKLLNRTPDEMFNLPQPPPHQQQQYSQMYKEIDAAVMPYVYGVTSEDTARQKIREITSKYNLPIIPTQKVDRQEGVRGYDNIKHNRDWTEAPAELANLFGAGSKVKVSPGGERIAMYDDNGQMFFIGKLAKTAGGYTINNRLVNRSEINNLNGASVAYKSIYADTMESFARGGVRAAMKTFYKQVENMPVVGSRAFLSAAREAQLKSSAVLQGGISSVAQWFDDMKRMAQSSGDQSLASMVFRQMDSKFMFNAMQTIHAGPLSIVKNGKAYYGSKQNAPEDVSKRVQQMAREFAMSTDPSRRIASVFIAAGADTPDFGTRINTAQAGWLPEGMAYTGQTLGFYTEHERGVKATGQHLDLWERKDWYTDNGRVVVGTADGDLIRLEAQSANHIDSITQRFGRNNEKELVYTMKQTGDTSGGRVKIWLPTKSVTSEMDFGKLGIDPRLGIEMLTQMGKSSRFEAHAVLSGEFQGAKFNDLVGMIEQEIGRKLAKGVDLVPMDDRMEAEFKRRGVSTEQGRWFIKHNEQIDEAIGRVYERFVDTRSRGAGWLSVPNWPATYFEYESFRRAQGAGFQVDELDDAQIEEWRKDPGRTRTIGLRAKNVLIAQMMASASLLTTGEATMPLEVLSRGGQRLPPDVMKLLLKRSSRDRSPYQELIKARLVGGGESEDLLKANGRKIMTLDELRAAMAANPDGTFIQRLKKTLGNNTLRVSNIPGQEFYVPGETVMWMATPGHIDRLKKDFFHTDTDTVTDGGDAANEIAKTKKAINAAVNWLDKLVTGDLSQADRYAERLFDSLHGETGLSAQKGIWRGANMANFRGRYGMQGTYVAVPGMAQNRILISDAKLQEMFPGSSADEINDLLKSGKILNVLTQRYPDVAEKITSLPALRIMTVKEAIGNNLSIRENFSGIGLSQFFMDNVLGDFDGDQIMAALASNYKMLKGEDGKDHLDDIYNHPAMNKMSSLDYIVNRQIKSIGIMTGDPNFVPGKVSIEQLFNKLEELGASGSNVSEVAKWIDTLKKMNENQGEGDSPAGARARKNWGVGRTPDELRQGYMLQALTGRQMERSYNSAVRNLETAYKHFGIVGDTDRLNRMQFLIHQRSVDKTLYGTAMRMWTALRENFTPFGLNQPGTATDPISPKMSPDKFTGRFYDAVWKTIQTIVGSSDEFRGIGRINKSWASDMAHGITRDEETAKKLEGIISEAYQQGDLDDAGVEALSNKIKTDVFGNDPKKMLSIIGPWAAIPLAATLERGSRGKSQIFANLMRDEQGVEDPMMRDLLNLGVSMKHGVAQATGDMRGEEMDAVLSDDATHISGTVRRSVFNAISKLKKTLRKLEPPVLRSGEDIARHLVLASDADLKHYALLDSLIGAGMSREDISKALGMAKRLMVSSEDFGAMSEEARAARLGLLQHEGAILDRGEYRGAWDTAAAAGGFGNWFSSLGSGGNIPQDIEEAIRISTGAGNVPVMNNPITNPGPAMGGGMGGSGGSIVTPDFANAIRMLNKAINGGRRQPFEGDAAFRNLVMKGTRFSTEELIRFQSGDFKADDKYGDFAGKPVSNELVGLAAKVSAGGITEKDQLAGWKYGLSTGEKLNIGAFSEANKQLEKFGGLLQSGNKHLQGWQATIGDMRKSLESGDPMRGTALNRAQANLKEMQPLAETVGSDRESRRGFLQMALAAGLKPEDARRMLRTIDQFKEVASAEEDSIHMTGESSRKRGFSAKVGGLFEGDLGQMGWGMFNLQRIWRMTGGQVQGAMTDYAKYNAGQLGAISEMGGTLGYYGPVADVIGQQNSMQKLRLAQGKAGWDLFGWIPQLIAGGGSGIDPSKPSGMMYAATALETLGGAGLTAALGKNLLGKLGFSLQMPETLQALGAARSPVDALRYTTGTLIPTAGGSLKAGLSNVANGAGFSVGGGLAALAGGITGAGLAYDIRAGMNDPSTRNGFGGFFSEQMSNLDVLLHKPIETLAAAISPGLLTEDQKKMLLQQQKESREWRGLNTEQTAEERQYNEYVAFGSKLEGKIKTLSAGQGLEVASGISRLTGVNDGLLTGSAQAEALATLIGGQGVSEATWKKAQLGVNIGRAAGVDWGSRAMLDYAAQMMLSSPAAQMQMEEKLGRIQGYTDASRAMGVNNNWIDSTSLGQMGLSGQFRMGKIGQFDQFAFSGASIDTMPMARSAATDPIIRALLGDKGAQTLSSKMLGALRKTITTEKSGLAVGSTAESITGGYIDQDYLDKVAAELGYAPGSRKGLTVSTFRDMSSLKRDERRENERAQMAQFGFNFESLNRDWAYTMGDPSRGIQGTFALQRASLGESVRHTLAQGALQAGTLGGQMGYGWYQNPLAGVQMGTGVTRGSVFIPQIDASKFTYDQAASLQGKSITQLGQAGLQYRQFYEQMAQQRTGIDLQREWQKEDAWKTYNRGMTRLGWNETDLNTNFGRQMTQFSQTIQDLTTNIQRNRTQSGWAQENLTIQGNQQALQFGWGMEDIDEAMKYATGRDRRKLAKQRERQTIQYGFQTDALGREEEQLKKKEQWSEEDFAKETSRIDQRRQWAEEDFAKEKERIETNRGWLKEDLDTTLSRIDTQAKLEDEQWKLKLKHFEEDQQMERLLHEENMKNALAMAGIQAQQQKEQELRWKEEYAQKVREQMEAVTHWLRINELTQLQNISYTYAKTAAENFAHSIGDPDGVVALAMNQFSLNAKSLFLKDGGRFSGNSMEAVLQTLVNNIRSYIMNQMSVG